MKIPIEGTQQLQQERHPLQLGQHLKQTLLQRSHRGWVTLEKI